MAEKKTYTVTVPALPKPKLKLSKGARQKLSQFLVLVVVAIIAGAGGGIWTSHNNSNTYGDLVTGTVGTQKKTVTTESKLISQIATAVGPSVVSVTDTQGSDSSSNSDDPFDNFFDNGNDDVQAAGTGIIISSDGVVMTNRHVVPSGTTDINITLSDGTEFKNVSVIGRTSSSDSLDVAFLKINDLGSHKLKPAIIGDSSTVQVGDDVVAIGNALGQFQNTVTSGIISGYGRSIEASDSTGTDSESLDDLFQTDAAINEGNSGGPLVNLNGQVIGMNTAIAGDAQNIGFAIPINDIKGLMESVLKTGKFERPYLGVLYLSVTADLANEYDLSVNNGAYIAPSGDNGGQTPIVSGGPADKAGLKVGDVITALNGTKIDSTNSLTSLIDKYQPGDKVSLQVVRDGKTITLTATLGTMPQTDE